MFQRIIEIIIFVITELQSKQVEEIDLDKLRNLGLQVPKFLLHLVG